MYDKLDDRWTVGLCGAHVALIMNPFEIAKTRLQLVGEEPKTLKKARSKFGSNLTVLTIWRTEGLKVLTKGSAPSAVQSALTNIASLQMLKIKAIEKFKPRRNEMYSLEDSFRLASVITMPAAILPSPLYLAKVRGMSFVSEGVCPKVGFQHYGAYTNAIGLLKNAYQTESGPYALYRAAMSNYIKLATLTSVAIFSYAKIRQKLEERKVIQEAYVPVLSAISGASVGAFIAAPLDLISTRLYNQGISRYGGNIQYKNYKDCLLQILYKEGFSGLYKHSAPTMFTLTLHSALSIYLWDYFGQLFQKSC